MKFDFSVDEACAITAGLREWFRKSREYEESWDRDMRKYKDFSEAWKYAADRAEYWHNVSERCNNVYFKILGEFIPEEIAK